MMPSSPRTFIGSTTFTVTGQHDSGTGCELPHRLAAGTGARPTTARTSIERQKFALHFAEMIVAMAVAMLLRPHEYAHC